MSLFIANLFVKYQANRTHLSSIKQYGALSCLAKSRLDRYYTNGSLVTFPFVFSFEVRGGRKVFDFTCLSEIQCFYPNG